MLPKYEILNRNNIASGVSQVDRLFNITANSVAQKVKNLQSKQLLKPDKYGTQILRNQELLKNISKEFYSLVNNLNSSLAGLTKKGWDIANAKNDADLLKFALPANKIPAKWTNLNLDAYAKFQKRNINGVNLSERIHSITEQNKQLYLDYLGTGITQGKSANEIARELIRVNNDPDNVTVYDKAGLPSKLALESKLLVEGARGPGIYKSPLKNMIRVARHETNVAYRTSDYERYNQLDFVVGIEVHLSASHAERMKNGDMCDDLQGSYPKDFKFTGWHIACLCFVTSILCTRSEMKEYLTTGIMKSVNEVKELSGAPKAWLLSTSTEWKKIDWAVDNQKLIGIKIK